MGNLRGKDAARVGKDNATLTAQHFAISRKAFYKWFKCFKHSKYNVQSLADQPKVSHLKGEGKIALVREYRMRHLSERYTYYMNNKLTALYEKEYPKRIYTWKIERVIRRYKLYPDQKKAEKTARKRVRAHEKLKKRITQPVKKGKTLFPLPA
jgi:hypothetical protein